MCGSARFVIDAETPLAVRQCWCRDCQHFACGNATINAMFRTETVSVSGPIVDYKSTADSGSIMHRRFCGRCGSHLFSEAEPRPQLIFVRVGALDDPEIAKPNSIIWTKSAPSWACFDPSLLTSEGQAAPAIV
jgi:hypothetical protein